MTSNEKLCKFCLQPIGKRVAFNALPGNDASCWQYLEVGESAHIECYIKMCAADMPRAEYGSISQARFYEYDKPDWISVNDALPEDGDMIAVCVDSMQTGCVCRYSLSEGLPCLVHGPLKCLGFTWKDVTHWIPLPRQPEDPHEQQMVNGLPVRLRTGIGQLEKSQREYNKEENEKMGKV